MPILPASAAMEEGLWWLYVVTSSIFGLTVCISVWVSYVMIETQNAIDELETHVMSILDDVSVLDTEIMKDLYRHYKF